MSNQEETIKKRSEDFSKWYLDVIVAADLADYAPVRGCIIFKPNGYAIWENFQKVLDKKFKETGHRNAYFPLLIPEEFLKKEAEHVEGFSPELAVVTHAGGKELEEKLVIRPTSETIIYDSFSKWVHSWRDLPILINQWCNVMRWEKKTKPFLRTTEFLWQEGHTAHETHDEAEKEALQMLAVYADFAKDYLAIPVIKGVKSESEKFAGALRTYTIEALMQDGKALQSGTSHNLGQNFAKAFDIKFLDKNEEEQYVWQTSWGLSTRLIGGLIMTHGDDSGIIMPPKIAPLHLVFVPIWKEESQREELSNKINELKNTLPGDIISHTDDRDMRPGSKYYDWERKGVPLRAEIGPRDLEQEQIILARRDNGEKVVVKLNEFAKKVKELLESIQENLFKKAEKNLSDNTYEVKDWDDFQDTLTKNGGFIHANWCGSKECEAEIKEKTKATIRCIPLERGEKDGDCIHCKSEGKHKAYFAIAY
ncbi:MAG: proline--tRNA ligase [Candidatus Nealsonbacteria bacterium]|nr:proline--tRNA ligase [Candidatus Nealsonbacteria bacterium]